MIDRIGSGSPVAGSLVHSGCSISIVLEISFVEIVAVVAVGVGIVGSVAGLWIDSSLSLCWRFCFVVARTALSFVGFLSS